MNITKRMIKKLVEQELQETGFKMAPGSLESDPVPGPQVTGPEYDYDIGPADLEGPLRGREDVEAMEFDEEDVMVDPSATDLRSMGAPYGQAIATVRENRITKNALHSMILEELHEYFG